MDIFELSALDESIEVNYVTDQAKFDELCAKWLTKPVLAVDTEFDRTNTYFHRLALIQIEDDESIYLIDPLEVKNLDALGAVFASTDVIKLLHSCGEDLQALHYGYGFDCKKIFDTQVAAAFCGHGTSIGYGSMVEKLLSVELEKDQTKTDWLQRPLTQKQAIYAAQDVQFLPKAYNILLDSMTEQWVEFTYQEIDSLFEQISLRNDFANAYFSVKGVHHMDAFQLNRVRKVAQWRETHARECDVPKTFIIRDNQLLELVKAKTPAIGDMMRVGCNRVSVRKYGADVVKLIQEADKEPESNYPKTLQLFHKLPSARELFSSLKKEADSIAKQANVPAEYLSNRRQIETYCLEYLDIPAKPNPNWDGWRKNLLKAGFDKILSKYSDVATTEQPLN